MASGRVAMRELLPGVEHRRSKYLNNRAEQSQQPTREREWAMTRFKSPGHAPRFLAACSGISPHVRSGRHRLRAAYRRRLAARVRIWQGVTGVAAAA